MLDILRNSARGTAGKVVVALIVLTFVLFGAESIVSIAANSSPATVNGDDISASEYQQLLNSRQQELANQYGAELAGQLINSGFLKNEVMESLVSQKIQSQMSEDLKFAVSDDHVLKTLNDIPAFQKDGKFDQETYKSLLAANGLTHQSFLQLQKAQGALTQFQVGISDSAFVLQETTNEYAKLDVQTRTVQYKEFSADNYAADVELTDDEISNFYSENQTQYMSDEKIKVKYLVLAAADLVAEQELTEDEIKAAYDSYIAGIAEQETREISHILFADGDKEESVQEALGRLNAGEDFADLARELSDDPGSAEFGGSLGVLTPGVFVPEFYDAAVALQNEGDVSGPVETQYGIHLIRLDAIDKVKPESFEAKRESLMTELKAQKAKEELELVKTQLSDEAFASDDIATVAESFDTDVKESDWFTSTSGDDYFAEPDVAAAAFSDQVKLEGLISNVVELADGSLITLQKAEYQPEDILPLEDVIDSVKAELTKNKAAELMAQAIEGELAAKTINSEGWSEPATISRTDSEVPTEVRNLAFELPKPANNEFSFGETSGNSIAYIVAVSGISDGDIDEQERESTSSFVVQTSGPNQYQMLYNIARDSADIKIRN